MVERDWSAGDGFSPRQARFSQNDERYTLALAGRLQMEVESRQNQAPEPNSTYVKEQAATRALPVTDKNAGPRSRCFRKTAAQ